MSDANGEIHETALPARVDHDGQAENDDNELELPSMGRELTRCERGLLRVLLDPQHFSTDVATRAKAAGISARSYHVIMRKQSFQELIVLAYRTALRESIGDVLQAAIDTAKTVGRDGQRDREVLLCMSGIHVPRQAVEVSVQRIVVGVVGVSLEELG